MKQLRGSFLLNELSWHHCVGLKDTGELLFQEKFAFFD